MKLLKLAKTFERFSLRVLSVRPFKAHDARGLRLHGKEEAARKGRDSSEFLMQSLNAEGVPFSGHSYERIATEVASLQLTHLQMEHVYEMGQRRLRRAIEPFMFHENGTGQCFTQFRLGACVLHFLC